MQACGDYLEYQYATKITNILAIGKTHHLPFVSKLFGTLYEIYGMLFFIHPFVQSCEAMSKDAAYTVIAAFQDMDALWRTISNVSHSTIYLYSIVMNALVIFA